MSCLVIILVFVLVLIVNWDCVDVCGGCGFCKYCCYFFFWYFIWLMCLGNLFFNKYNVFVFKDFK